MIGPKVPKPTKAEERDAYETVTVRDADTCQRCRRYCGPPARDHRRNRSAGGYTVPSNLQILGLGCHQWKTENPRQAWDEGWGVPAWARWAEWPARRWVTHGPGHTELAWVLYDDEGTWREITEAEARHRIEQGGIPF
jgi:hypothetical protein